MKQRKYGKLGVSIADTDTELGTAAAEDFATAVKTELTQNDEIAVILALGASQDSFFAALKARDDIEWARITVLHVDTYYGVADDRPESGASRLRRNLLDQVKPKAFLPLIGDHEPVEEELKRYSELLEKLQPQVCTLGVGDSGHLAFNDPPADFGTRDLVRIVALSEITRNQICNAGTFATLDEVPHFGLSLTMYALLRPRTVITLVHEPAKADVIRDALEGPVTMMCPASILQRHGNAHLYLSTGAASRLAQ